MFLYAYKKKSIRIYFVSFIDQKASRRVAPAFPGLLFEKE